MDTQTEKNWTKRLAAVGMKLVDPETFAISCERCDFGGIPLIQSGGGFKRGWWRCGNGCNADKKRLPSR